jgi:hypothetical protein
MLLPTISTQQAGELSVAVLLVLVSAVLELAEPVSSVVELSVLVLVVVPAWSALVLSALAPQVWHRRSGWP